MRIIFFKEKIYAKGHFRKDINAPFVKVNQFFSSKEELWRFMYS